MTAHADRTALVDRRLRDQVQTEAAAESEQQPQRLLLAWLAWRRRWARGSVVGYPTGVVVSISSESSVTISSIESHVRPHCGARSYN